MICLAQKHQDMPLSASVRKIAEPKWLHPAKASTDTASNPATPAASSRREDDGRAWFMGTIILHVAGPRNLKDLPWKNAARVFIAFCSTHGRERT